MVALSEPWIGVEFCVGVAGRLLVFSASVKENAGRLGEGRKRSLGGVLVIAAGELWILCGQLPVSCGTALAVSLWSAEYGVGVLAAGVERKLTENVGKVALLPVGGVPVVVGCVVSSVCADETLAAEVDCVLAAKADCVLAAEADCWLAAGADEVSGVRCKDRLAANSD